MEWCSLHSQRWTMMRNANEELLAEVLKERIVQEIDSPTGIAEFFYDDVEVDDEVATVKGWIEWESAYEESCNYVYYSYVFVNIDCVEGMKCNELKLSEILTKMIQND